MKIVKMDNAVQEPVGGALFPSGNVARQSLLGAKDSQQLSFTLLRFEAGAGNAFHIHTHDQALVVVSGIAVVATEHEQHEVGPSEVVLFPAGENHWHAASAREGVTFLSITPAGTTTTVT